MLSSRHRTVSNDDVAKLAEPSVFSFQSNSDVVRFVRCKLRSLGPLIQSGRSRVAIAPAGPNLPEFIRDRYSRLDVAKLASKLARNYRSQDAARPPSPAPARALLAGQVKFARNNHVVPILFHPKVSGCVTNCL